MTKTIITPQAEDISIHVPHDYVGRKIEVLIYAVDELTDSPVVNKIANNSSLRGTLHLSDAEYKDFQQHAQNMRNEWE